MKRLQLASCELLLTIIGAPASAEGEDGDDGRV